MDLGTCVLLGLEGCFALWLLWRSRLLESKTALWLSVALTAGAFLVRVPVSYLMSKIFAGSLFAIGLATPCSSAVQIILCLICYSKLRKNL